MQEKSDLMRIYVQAGYRNLDEIRNHYNSFSDGGNVNSTPQPYYTPPDYTQGASSTYVAPPLITKFKSAPYQPFAIPDVEQPILTQDTRTDFQRVKDDNYKKTLDFIGNNPAIFNIDPTYQSTGDKVFDANYNNMVARGILDNVGTEVVGGLAGNLIRAGINYTKIPKIVEAAKANLLRGYVDGGEDLPAFRVADAHGNADKMQYGMLRGTESESPFVNATTNAEAINKDKPLDRG